MYYYIHARPAQKAVAVLQFVLESLIITLLHMCQYILVEYYKGHGDKPKQVALNGRNFKAIVNLLRGDIASQLEDIMPYIKTHANLERTLWPILRGALKNVRPDDYEDDDEDEDDGDGGRCDSRSAKSEQ